MPLPAPPQQKRKKWSEEEERSLIDKYEEMESSGSLVRLRTREKKFRPIADHVTSSYHRVDPTSYPFPWSWKDASTKVQNMRHQYLLVKQKLISTAQSLSNNAHLGDDVSVDWADGVSLWPNFLRYKDVFGDAPLPSPSALKPQPDQFIDADGDLALGLAAFDEVDGEEQDFDYHRDAVPVVEQPVAAESKKIRAKKLKKKEKGRRSREEEREEREWEERMDRRRGEWRKRMEEMLAQHRVQMAQIQARVLGEQQAIIGQLLGIVSHWATGVGGGGGDGTHMNGIVMPGENRSGSGDGDGQEDPFIVNG